MKILAGKTHIIIQDSGDAEFELEENAKLIHVMLGVGNWERRIKVGKNASLITKDVVINQDTKTSVELLDNADYVSYTLQVINGSSKVKIVHLGINANSKIKNKSLSEKETSFVGKTIIQANALNSKCSQEQHAILLMPGAKAHNIPILDIKNSEVTANHSASIGQIDEEQLFYMRSRGLNCVEARNALIKGYLEPFLLEIPNKEELEENILALLR